MFDYATVRPIYGPPGTGKTTRCIAIVSALLEKGVDPQQIAYVAFTKKAAWEATDRVSKKLQIPKTGMQHFSTIHAMANRTFKGQHPDSLQVMRPRDWEAIGERMSMPVRGHWRITEDADFIGGGGVQYGPGDFAMSQINLAHARRIPIEEQMSKWANHMDFARFNCLPDQVVRFSAYADTYKADEGKYDFNDMLSRAMACEPLPLRYAIIDEAQDLSAMQWTVCDALLRNCEEIWVAGDDDQAIYRFSGADAHTFLGMGKLDTAEVLHQTWRLPAAIYEYSKKLTNRISERVEKEYTTEKPGGSVKREYLRQLPISEGEWLLLVRNRGMMKKFEEFLRAKTYAYRMDGRASVDPTDAAAIRAWETVRKDGRVDRDAVFNIVKRLESGKGLKRGVKTNVSTLLPQQDDYGWQDLEDVGVMMSREVEWYTALQGIKPAQRIYLRGVAKRGELFDEPRISVNTIHGVKGGEADNVAIIPQMGRLTWDGYRQNPDDEHRVAYVAATRAKQNLYITLDGDQGMAYPY